MHPVPARTLASDFFWRTMAMMMLFAVGWVAWLVWQLTPHPVVTELAYPSSRGKIPAPAVAASSRFDSAPAPQAAPPPAPAAAKAPLPQRPEKGMVDSVRLATELTTPIPRRSSR